MTKRTPLFNILAWAIACSVHLLCWHPTSGSAAETDEQRAIREHFEKKVRPILVQRCYECHSGSAKRIEGSLRIDHPTFLIQGGDSGPVIDKETLSQSLLLQAVRYGGLEMPPSGRLPIEEVETLADWVQKGAYWPDEPVPESPKEPAPFSIEHRKQSHWAWKQIVAPEIPDTQLTDLRNNAIDAFVLSKQREHQLSMSEQADRVTAIRRLHWDLLGVPPSNDTLQQWTQCNSVDWYENYLDSLLADPQLGVRFARHWLDLVRYAQSRGHEFDEDTPGAEHYRDYVVRAFNAEVPFDQFLTEHIAGDLLPDPRRHPTKEWNESVLGTGFWHLGEWVHSPVDTRKDETDRFDNMVDVFSKTFLGLTVACARCHDHKFDAISTEDYYALYGYLRSSHYRLVRFETDAEDKRLRQELDGIRAKYRPLLKEVFHQLTAEANSSKVAEAQGENSKTDSLSIPLPIDDSRVLLDSRTIRPQDWHTDGFVFGQEVAQPNWDSVYPVSNKGAANGYSLHWSSFPSISASPRWLSEQSEVHRVNSKNRRPQIDTAGKTFLTPSFTLQSAHLSFLVRGDLRVFVAVDSHRLIAGPLHGETVFEPKSNGPDSMRWVKGPNLSRYIGKRIHLEFSPANNHALDLYQVIEDTPPEAADCDESDRSLARDGMKTEDKLQRILTSDPTVPSTPASIEFRRLVDEWVNMEREAENKFRRVSRLAMAMQDGSGQNDFLLIRGNVDRPAAEVPRRFLEALGGKQSPVAPSSGSGRLELARDLLRQDNPLVARVFVNRWWHHLLGRGIVPTTDDFGVQGLPPTHPELLDYLSVQLRESGWSFKQIVREICSSHTYRQQAPVAGFSKQDPTNQWLAFANIKKLEGEAVRDGMLAASGQLDWQLEGNTEPVFLNDFLTGRGRPGKSGMLHGNSRRSLYLEVRRNFLNPMLTAFDMPTPFSSMGRRNISNVPAQALTMLNDPLVHWIAERWSENVLRSEGNIRSKASSMLLAARGREPESSDLDNAVRFIQSEINLTNEPEAWKSFAHVLLNSKEMLFRF
jgi:hypothetical protein